MSTSGGRDSSAVVLAPSGDTSGVKDAAAINASLVANGHTVLSPGQWYVTNIGVVNNSRWLQGAGPATVINGPAGGSAITVTGVGDLEFSDFTVAIGAGGLAFTVNGMYDSNVHDVWFSGATAAGAVLINGDLAMEQNWTDITGRTVGGVGFDIERTTSTFTGSAYLARVRFVTPPAGATGFRANSSAGSPSLNLFSAVDCVFDAYLGDAWYINNCAQIFMNGCWGAVTVGAPVGSVPMRITGGQQIVIQGQYLFNALANGVDCLIAGTPTGITLDGMIFDGIASTIALGLATAVAPGVILVPNFQAYNNMAITDVARFVQMGQLSAGSSGAAGEETQPRTMVNVNNAPLTSGLLVLSYFTAQKTYLCGHLEVATGSGATGGTYAGMGLFSVDKNGLLTLVAKGEQVTTPALWSSAFQYVGGINTKIALSAPFQIQQGVEYAVGALFVGSGAPQLAATVLTSGAGGLAVAGTPLAQISASLAGQATLGAIGSTHTQASLATYSFLPYFVLET